jgi:hypothetical protein
MEPIIRAGETYPLASDMSKADALAYWNGPEDETFVVEEGDEILGTSICALIGQNDFIGGHWQGRRAPDGRALFAASSRERLQSYPIQLRRQHE